MSLFKRDDTPLPAPRYAAVQQEVKTTHVAITINGRELIVPSTWSVLRACRENGIFVPSLCNHPTLTPTGRCGICVVSITRPVSSSSSGSTPDTPGLQTSLSASVAGGMKTRIAQSCKTLVQQGMVIQTDTPEVLHQAQSNLREFLGGRGAEAFGGGTAVEIEEVARFARREAVAGRKGGREYAIVRDQAKCVSCTRCVRACSGLQNMNILAIDLEQPAQPIVFEGNRPLHQTNCVACGQCTLVCPSGAVSERDDTATVLEEIAKSKSGAAGCKTMIVMTAPSARITLGETQGDAPGSTDIGKTVAALHAAGFELVFDTTFAADTCAVLEATELLHRIRAKGPFPMFTSCCPGWVNVVDKLYPHLRPHLSRCRSPMMMLGAMVRDWFTRRGLSRQNYFLVALMPCTAKKTEIERPELLGPGGLPDVDVVLTTREMGRLLKARGVRWSKLPGSHMTEYDPPFNNASGGGALFGASGGVMEAAMRVAHTVLSKHDVTAANTSMFDACRAAASKLTGEWVSEALDVTPDTRHKRQLAVAIVSGARSIQAFLKDQFMSDPNGLGLVGAGGKGADTSAVRHFVEMMCCPHGCIGGGGQPASLDDHVFELRRSSVYRADASSQHASSLTAQQEFIRATFREITSETARKLLEYEPPLPTTVSPTASLDSPRRRPRSPSSVSATSDGFSSGTVGEVTIIFGSQGGATAAYARRIATHLRSEVGCVVNVFPMDQFPVEKLASIQILILMTSTWESEHSLAPHNADEFFKSLCAAQPEQLRTMLLGTGLAICGFGSTKYPHFCGFADQLQEAFVSLGAYPILGLSKVDVDAVDKGRERFGMWTKQITHTLLHTGLPPPRYLVVPAIAPSGTKSVISVAPGYRTATVVRVKQYKESQTPGGKYFLVELSTGKAPIRCAEGESIHVLPCNPRSETETVVNALFPGMLNQSVSLVPIGNMTVSELPSHLTVRQLFEQYFALSAKPARAFVEKMELMLRESAQDPKLAEVLATPETFQKWAQANTYFTVLQAYKSVVPPLEILISMLPLMEPRCYTPLLIDEPHIGKLSFCFKLLPNGVCGRFLSNLKKGDTVQIKLAKSLFTRPTDAFLNPRVFVPVPRPVVSLDWTDSASSLLDLAGSPTSSQQSSTQQMSSSPPSSPYSSQRKGAPPPRFDLSSKRKPGSIDRGDSFAAVSSPLASPSVHGRGSVASGGDSTESYADEPLERAMPQSEVALRRWLKNHSLERYADGLVAAGCTSLAYLASDKCSAFVAEHKRLRKAMPDVHLAIQMLRVSWHELVELNSKTRRPPKLTRVVLPSDTSK